MENNNISPFVRIKGSDKHAAEVIAELERRGGINTYNFSGCDERCWYYIGLDGVIGLTNKLTNFTQQYYKELLLPNNNGSNN